jgi:hypothetical protein
MDELLEQLVLQLIDSGYVTMDYIFVDGTKIEANTNKYSFVWGKAIKNYDAKLREKAKSLLVDVHEAMNQECR